MTPALFLLSQVFVIDHGRYEPLRSGRSRDFPHPRGSDRGVHVPAQTEGISRQVQFLHPTGVAVVLGIGAGFLTETVLDESVKFNENFFFYFVLPPIIFAGGYNMKRRRFFKNLSYIMLFGVLGTIINFIVSVICVIYINNQHWVHDETGKVMNLTAQDALLICAVLSSSDTVAALTVIDEHEAPDVQSILVGEGVVNDAVSIILFNSALSMQSYSINAHDVGVFIGGFLSDLLASIAIGILFGVISALLTKYVRELERHPPYETAMLFLISYLGYLVTLILHFSGIISILCTGILMGHYTWYNLSKEGRIVSRAAFEIMGEMLDCFVFVYVGFGTYTYVGQTVSYGFIGLMIVVVLLSRFVVTVLMPILLKFVWKSFKLKVKELIIIWVGGSIRGAIAFALILSVDSNQTHYKTLMKTTILGIVLFTVVAFGSLLPMFKQIFPILRMLYPGNSQILPHSFIPLSFEMMSKDNDPSRSLGEAKSRLHQKWRNVDDAYLKRWLIKPEHLGLSTAKDVMEDASTQTNDNEVAEDWSLHIVQ